MVCLQADIAHWQDKYTHVANNLLPHAESATSFAKEDAENAGNEAKAARQAAAAALVQVQEIRAQFEQVLIFLSSMHSQTYTRPIYPVSCYLLPFLTNLKAPEREK